MALQFFIYFFYFAGPAGVLLVGEELRRRAGRMTTKATKDAMTIARKTHSRTRELD